MSSASTDGTGAEADAITVFVSYTEADRQYADWIASQLHQRGFAVLYAPWGALGGQIVQAMSEALRSADRTVAVLTDNYFESSFAMSEWNAAAHRAIQDDADRLIPVVVEQLSREPTGIDRNFARVDLVDGSDEDRIERLVSRIRGAAVMPAAAGSWPGRTTPEPGDRPEDPRHAADVEDERFWTEARTVLASWRARYSTRLDELVAARELFADGGWAVLDEERSSTARLALEAAADLDAIPTELLRRCAPYGLRFPEAVLDGTSRGEVELTFDFLLAHPERLGDEPIDSYVLENGARILTAAIALARFDIGRLPRGFETPASAPFPAGLASTALLVGRRYPGGTGLDILALDDTSPVVATLVARNLALTTLAARRNKAGSIDVVARDDNHLYAWWGPSQIPDFASSTGDRPIAAAFIGDDGSDGFFVLQSERGLIERVDRDGKVRSDGMFGWECEFGAAWSDGADYGVVATTHGRDVLGWTVGGTGPQVKDAASIWPSSLLAPLDESPAEWLRPSWSHGGEVAIVDLDGFTCAMVTRRLYNGVWGERGVAVLFLDVRTLEPLRAPLLVPSGGNEVVLAFGRWLVVTTYRRDRDPSNGLALWDLRSSSSEPALEVCDLDARGDLRALTVLDGDEDGFRTVVAVDNFGADPPPGEFEVFVTTWPSGDSAGLGVQYSGLWPVSTSSFARTVR